MVNSSANSQPASGYLLQTLPRQHPCLTKTPAVGPEVQKGNCAQCAGLFLPKMYAVHV